MSSHISHPGFQRVSRSIAAKEGIPLQNARAILAASSRKASRAAKAKNPKLAKVSGKPKVAKRFSRLPNAS